MSGNRRVDAARLWDSLMRMAEIGATEKGGVRRLALSALDGQARALFRAWCEDAGLSVRVDAIGNMFAWRAGRDPARKPVLFGSHLDTQPSGGRFDGALGVLAGLEAMRVLEEQGVETEAPLVLVNWTDEEGARFGHSLMGSAVWAGNLEIEKAYALADMDGVRVGDALAAIGARGSDAGFPQDGEAYFELHIEQGPVLERSGTEIGVVTGGQGMVWYDLLATGQDAHAGTTPPAARKDALVCAARVIDLVDRMMRARGEAGRGTVGELHVSPNSRNTVPGSVRFTAEFRHPNDAELARIAAQFPREAGFIARDANVTLKIDTVFRLPATLFDAGCVAAVREAAGRLGYSSQDIVSGAGHDALSVAKHMPAAMIFVPCADGLSHNETESITAAQAEAGCNVLLEAVLAKAGVAG